MTWVIAHRGASRDRPENTRVAFDEALRQGCDAIELDAQLTRDGVPVVWHDRTLVRAGGGRRKIATLDHSDLADLDAAARWPTVRARQRILTLEGVLERYGRQTRLLVELKARGAPGDVHDLRLARTAATLIRRLRLVQRTLVLCFDPLVLDACREVVPGIRTVMNLKPPRRMSPSLRRRLDALDMLSTNVRSLTPSFGRAVAAAGTPLLVYTCNTTRKVDLALASGATGVMSDRPGWLAGVLADRGVRHFKRPGA